MTIGDLAEQPDEWYGRQFGKRGEGMRSRAMGRDEGVVEKERLVKSVSAETTFPGDIERGEELREEVAGLAGRVLRELEGKGVEGRRVRVKLRLADYRTFTRQVRLGAATGEEGVILERLWGMVEGELGWGRAFRLVGVGVSGLREAGAVGELGLGERAGQLALPLSEKGGG